MPSDLNTQLGQQLHNIMSLRLVLLKKNRNFEEENLVDSILTLFESYLKAGRSRPDITLMLARDFAFHALQHQQQMQQQQQMGQPSFQRQMSIPTMQGLSISAPMQQEPCQLDHMHHGEYKQQKSHSISLDSRIGSELAFQVGSCSPPTSLLRRHSGTVSITRGQSSTSISSSYERQYSNPDFSTSPHTTSAPLSRLESKIHGLPLDEDVREGLPE